MVRQKGHDPVAGKLVDGPFILMNLIHQDLEAPVHDLVDFFGISFSDKDVKLATSANRTVTSFRSPSMELREFKILSARNLGV